LLFSREGHLQRTFFSFTYIYIHINIYCVIIYIYIYATDGACARTVHAEVCMHVSAPVESACAHVSNEPGWK